MINMDYSLNFPDSFEDELGHHRSFTLSSFARQSPECDNGSDGPATAVDVYSILTAGLDTPMSFEGYREPPCNPEPAEKRARLESPAVHAVAGSPETRRSNGPRMLVNTSRSGPDQGDVLTVRSGRRSPGSSTRRPSTRPPPRPTALRRDSHSQDRHLVACELSRRTQQTRAHYAIEKRYRANLNDKFDELRNCLVAARSYLAEDFGAGNEEEEENGEGCSEPDDGSCQSQEGPKMSKAQVLTEAVDYISYLEQQNDRYMEYIDSLEHLVNDDDDDLGYSSKHSERG